MSIGVTKIFCAVLMAFLMVALSSTALMQKQPDCTKANDPPWFKTDNCRNKIKTFVFAGGYAKSDHSKSLCFYRITVCGTKVWDQTLELPYPSTCRSGKDFAQPMICCDELNKAVRSKQPCDPLQDTDCDGIPNDQDTDPLRQEPPNPDPDHKCGQLGQDVFDLYLKAGANEDTAAHAGQSAREDCRKRRAAKACGEPDPTSGSSNENPNASVPSYPPDLDSDNKCKQLGQDVYEAYLKAGANEGTAAYAGQSAREDCMKRRASKVRP